jgi:hypothetical protein
MIFLSIFVDYKNFEEYNYMPLKISKIKRRTYDIDCSLIIDKDIKEINKAKDHINSKISKIISP